MQLVDADRVCWAAQHGYAVRLASLSPLNCSPKNNLIVGWPLLMSDSAAAAGTAVIEGLLGPEVEDYAFEVCEGRGGGGGGGSASAQFLTKAGCLALVATELEDIVSTAAEKAAAAAAAAATEAAEMNRIGAEEGGNVSKGMAAGRPGKNGGTRLGRPSI